MIEPLPTEDNCVYIQFILVLTCLPEQFMLNLIGRIDNMLAPSDLGGEIVLLIIFIALYPITLKQFTRRHIIYFTP